MAGRSYGPCERGCRIRVVALEGTSTAGWETVAELKTGFVADVVRASARGRRVGVQLEPGLGRGSRVGRSVRVLRRAACTRRPPGLSPTSREVGGRPTGGLTAHPTGQRRRTEAETSGRIAATCRVLAGPHHGRSANGPTAWLPRRGRQAQGAKVAVCHAPTDMRCAHPARLSLRRRPSEAIRRLRVTTDRGVDLQCPSLLSHVRQAPPAAPGPAPRRFSIRSIDDSGSRDRSRSPGVHGIAPGTSGTRFEVGVSLAAALICWWRPCLRIGPRVTERHVRHGPIGSPTLVRSRGRKHVR